MTAPTLASAKTIQPSSANYNFTVEDKYKGTATRTLSKSGSTWKYNVKARVAGVASASQSSTFTINGNNVTPSKASTTYKLFGLGRNTQPGAPLWYQKSYQHLSRQDHDHEYGAASL